MMQSAADWKRASGRFSRQRWTARSRSTGTAAPEEESCGGSSLRIEAMTSAPVLPPKARWPETIS